MAGGYKKLASSSFLVFLVFLSLFLNLVKIVLRPVWRLMMGSRVPVVVRTPDDRFEGLRSLGYNFEPYYLSIDGGCGIKLPRVHYLDEGPRHGPVVLCLHGEPAWSFLYRKMIPGLVNAGYRVIVPDFIGFGKSDKYTNPDNYTHEMHCFVLRKLLDHLNISKMTLVCQDWGGLIGLTTVKDVPHMFSNLVIMNTGLPAPIMDFNDDNGDPVIGPPSTMTKLQQVLPFILWRSVVQLFGTNLPIERVFGFALKKNNVDPAVVAAYAAPFPSRLYKGGAARWPLLVPMLKADPVTAHLEGARNCLRTWKKPVLVMFSDSDPVTRGSEKLFLNLAPHAKQVVVEGAGHFLQETHGELLADNIVRFLKEEQ